MKFIIIKIIASMHIAQRRLPSKTKEIIHFEGAAAFELMYTERGYLQKKTYTFMTK